MEQMTGSMAWGMAIVRLLILVLLILSAAALVKYLFFSDPMKERGKTLGILLGISAIAALVHYIDNITHLPIYPDLPDTTVADIIEFGAVMALAGIAGYVLFLYKRYATAVYVLYVYCLMDLIVLGHYTRARMRQYSSFFEFPIRIQLLIFFEVITALIVAGYLLMLHRAIKSGR